jgi:hypothetical protein
VLLDWAHLAPVFMLVLSFVPPQTIMALPVQTAVWADRAESVVEGSVVHVFAVGL